MVSDHARRHLQRIFAAGVASVDPCRLVHASTDRITRFLQRHQSRRVLLAAAGKAALGMAAAAQEILGGRIVGGIVLTADRAASRPIELSRITLRRASHPVPDPRGVAATGEVLAMVERSDASTAVLALLSGGGSALLVAPDGVDLDDKRSVTEALLSAGVTIRELNTVRKHLSGIKGGRLAERTSPRPLLSLVLSDVVGDDLSIVASGPTCPDQSTYREAEAILLERGIAGSVARPVLERLRCGSSGLILETPKPGDRCFEKVENHLIGNNRTLLDAARLEAMRMGREVVVRDAPVVGEAREAGRLLAAEAMTLRRVRAGSDAPLGLISGGETTVAVRGAGVGGRNTELALAFAQSVEGTEGVNLLSAGTDGIDGTNDAAGAFADGATILRGRKQALAGDTALAENNSGAFFDRLGDLFVTGPTGTNVSDVQIVLIDPPFRSNEGPSLGIG